METFPGWFPRAVSRQRWSMKTKKGPKTTAHLPSNARLFPDEWLLQFNDPYERIHAVATRYLEHVKANNGSMRSSHHIEAAMLGKHFVFNEGFPLMAGFPNFKVGGITPQARDYIVSMHEWLRDYSALRLDRDATERADSLEEHFQILLDNDLGYDLSDQQLIDLRRWVTELQAKISGTCALSEHRRERLLKRLEKLQLELHTKLSSLDRLYGTTMEVVVVAQTLGDLSQSVIDIAAKIFGIVWAVHSCKDGRGLAQTVVPLPLPPPESFEIPLPLPLPFAIACSRATHR